MAHPTPSLAPPLVGVRTNRCHACDGCGVIGVDRGTRHPGDSRRCSDCDGTGLARTLADLIQERREILNEMRSSRDMTTRETLRAVVAALDVEIAEMRRAA